MTDATLDDVICEVLARQPDLDKRGLLAGIGRSHPRVRSQLTTSILNSRLYAMLGSGRVSKDDASPPRWKLAKAREGAPPRQPARLRGRAVPTPRVAASSPQAPRADESAPPPKIQIAPTVSRSEETWDEDQRRVIEAPIDACILVEAAPGTGKTAVACARAGHLVLLGSNPASIHFASFTRTAVAELRSRIAAALGDDGKARSIRIATFDSTAWQLVYGFSAVEVQRLFGGFDVNIQQAIGLLRSGRQEVEDYLDSLEHLIIDEAQDITGVRTEFVMEMIRRRPAHCGVTIFGDPTQGIYGWTSDDSERGDASDQFMNLLRQEFDDEFEDMQLAKIYRTASPELLRIHREVRPLVPTHSNGSANLRQIKDAVCSCSHRQIQNLEQSHHSDDVLVLFRRRAEALMASSYLSRDGVQHRLRISGLPTIVHPWIGWLLSEVDPTVPLSKAVFRSVWEAREPLAPRLFYGLHRDMAFELLQRFASNDRGDLVQVARLREVISRSHPPQELTLPECGIRGPILGTIHASKGREADRVVIDMNLAEASWDGRDSDATTERAREAEECRVLYVAATRAKAELTVIPRSGAPRPVIQLESGRACRGTDRSVQIEIGRKGDVDEFAQVGAVLFPTSEAARRAQQLLADAWGTTRNVVGRWQDREQCHRLFLTGEDQEAFACLGSAIAYDVAQAWNRRFPKNSYKNFVLQHIPHLYLIGARTVAVTPDDRFTSQAHAPWARSGFFLAPVIKGFDRLPWPKRR